MKATNSSERKTKKRLKRSSELANDGSDIEPNHYGTGNSWDQASNDANQYGTGIHWGMGSVDFDVNLNAEFASHI